MLREGLSSAAVIYDKQEDKIILVYTGRQKDVAGDNERIKKPTARLYAAAKNNTRKNNADKRKRQDRP